MAGPTLESLGTLGYLPDPPRPPGKKADWDFTTKLMMKLKAVHSGDVDLREHCTDTDQRNAGSCAGNATADSVEVLNSIEGLPPVQLARLFVYALARNFMDMDGDGRSDIDKDDGTFIRLCFEVLSKFGICREDIPAGQGGWPYDLSKLHELPDLKAMRKATGHRIHSYYRIVEEGDDRLNCIIEALRANHPVVFGTDINKAFVQLRNEGPVGPPDGVVVGGHAMLIVGYLSGLGFIVKNSWGSDWGDGGFCIMKPEYISWPFTRDIWVPTKGMTFR
jgi:hypothetical protein